MRGPEPIRDRLRSAWDRYGDRPAVVIDSGVHSYRELGERVLRLARLLARLGVGSGNAVCYVVSNDPEALLEVRLATYELGATLFAIPASLLESGRTLIQGVDPRVVVYDPGFVPGIPEWLVHICPAAHALPTQSASGPYDGLLRSVMPTPVDTAVDADMLAAVGFTSGTTGPPKGITASYGAVTWSCAMMQRVFSETGDHDGGILIGIPLYAAGGGMLVPALVSGATVYAPSRFDPEGALSLMDRGEVVSAFLTPSMIIDLLDFPDLGRYDMGRVKHIVYGTSIMPVPKLEEAIRRIGPVFVGGYGMAEVLPPVTVLASAEHGTKAQPAPPEVLSSVGTAVEGVEIRVAGGDGRALSAGEVGEVEVRSPAVTKGYWCDVGRTLASRHDGWWRSGDVGFVDGEQRLHILSRRADLLWIDGEPFYPRLFEEACNLHPAVKEACAVQRAPESPVVIAVSLRSSHRRKATNGRTTAQIHDLVRQVVGAPVAIDDIMVFDEIPRSLQGKVLHREVRGAVKTGGGAGVA